tara:strand:+ start:14644 stop:17460 length:2817 start_codon:yes stop_codon:yes gene_type:complete
MAVKQERIGYYGKFTPTSLDTSAADKMRALAGLGETVANTALAIGKPIAVQKGAEEGAIAGSKAGRVDPATGELIAPPEQRKFGYSASAFNSAVENSYLGNVSFELDQSVKSAQEQFPDDIMGYNKLVDASKQGLLSKMPEQYRGSAELVFDKLNAKAASYVAKAEKAKDLALTTAGIEQGAVVLSDIVTNDAYAGNVGDAKEGLAEFTAATLGLVETADLDPGIALQRINSLTDRITVQAKLGEVNRAVLDPSFEMKDRLVNGRAIVEAFRNSPDQSLSAEQNQELLNKLDVQVSTLELKAAKDAATLSSEQMSTLSNLDIAIKNQIGAPQDLIDEVYKLNEQGYFKTSAGVSSRVNLILGQQSSDQKKNDGMVRVSNLVNGEKPVTGQPIIPVTQKDVDNTYEELINVGLSTDPDKRGGQVAQITKMTGYLPSQARTEIRNNLVSGDTDKIGYAVDTINRIQEIPGIGEVAFTDTEVAFASLVGESSGYFTPEEAIANAKAITGTGSPTQKAMADARAVEIKSKDNDKVFGSEVYAEEVTKQMTGLFLFDSKSDFKGEIAFAELVSDYGAVTENLYKAGTVDIESAKKNAMTRIQANWGRGEFGLMKYPPEKFPAYQLNVTGDTSYIRDEIYNDLQSNGINVERENIRLISDAETSRSAGNNQPTYAIMIRANDGTLQSVSALDPDGNMSSRFQPDVEKGNTLQAARIKAETEGKMNKYGTLDERKIKAAKIAEKFGTDNPLKQDEREAMRAVLQSSTNPFALIGKGIKEFKNIPDAITVENIKKVLLATGMPQLTNKVGEAANFIVEEINNASNQYVSSLARPKNEIEEIDTLIAEGKAVEGDSTGIPASRTVTVYPIPTEKEEAAGIIPEPYVMMQQNYSSAQVKKLFTKDESKKKFTKGFKVAVDKVGQEEAEIIFINYFGQEMVNALKGIGE